MNPDQKLLETLLQQELHVDSDDCVLKFHFIISCLKSVRFLYIKNIFTTKHLSRLQKLLKSNYAMIKRIVN